MLKNGKCDHEQQIYNFSEESEQSRVALKYDLLTADGRNLFFVWLKCKIGPKPLFSLGMKFSI